MAGLNGFLKTDRPIALLGLSLWMINHAQKGMDFDPCSIEYARRPQSFYSTGYWANDVASCKRELYLAFEFQSGRLHGKGIDSSFAGGVLDPLPQRGLYMLGRSVVLHVISLLF